MFTTSCDIRVRKGGIVELMHPLVFEHKNMRITLYPGFRWNLANIPRVLWEELGCPFEFVMESGLHDGLYASGLFGREQSDKYWYIALRSGGEYKDPVDKVKAKLLHAGVRLGGEPYYKAGSIADAREFIGVEFL